MTRSVLSLLSLLLLFSCNPEEPETPPLQVQNFEDKSREVEVEVGTPGHPRPPQYVSPPPVPEVVTFAGDTIPLHRHDVREALEYELTVNTFFHSHTMTIMKKLERWRPLIEQTLHENLIPVDFLYLAVAESELDNTAESFAGAMGMWQFMKSTAREYDMEVDRSVDMRRDPKLSTAAAAKYLRESYIEFNDWALVAASYNRGIKGIKDLVEEQQVNSFFDLHLNKETARYVYRIIALKLILENPEAYGYFLKPEDKYSPYEFTTIVVEDDIDNLVEFARKHGTTYKELRILNPWFNNTSKYELEVPRKKAYELRLPIVAVDSLRE